ncbi:MAG: hypothetical protein ACYCOU_00955 [Sulfobacillus sp.]
MSTPLSSLLEQPDNWDFREADTKEGTHVIHSYPAMMIPQVRHVALFPYYYIAGTMRALRKYRGGITTMAIRQVGQSFQNDGNFNQLDLRDEKFHGPLMRIETFRGSHPNEGAFSVTAAGSSAKSITGGDHLGPESNHVFRNMFSVGTPEQMEMTPEIREGYDENGAWEIRARDLG